MNPNNSEQRGTTRLTYDVFVQHDQHGTEIGILDDRHPEFSELAELNQTVRVFLNRCREPITRYIFKDERVGKIDYIRFLIMNEDLRVDSELLQDRDNLFV